MNTSASALEKVKCSYLLYKEDDLPILIQNVMQRKENCETEFVEAIPLFVSVLSPEDVRTFLIPFIRNWISLGDKSVVIRFTSLLTFFMPPHSSILVFLDLLFPICEMIRQSAMFIEQPIMKMCERVLHVFDKDAIQTFFLPVLDQLYLPANTDSQGVAIRMQSFFTEAVDQKWVSRIENRMYSLANHSSTFVRTRVLNSLPNVIPAVENKHKMMDAILIPCFEHTDFKVRAAAVVAATEMGKIFFSIEGYAEKVFELAKDKSWCVRFAFVQNFENLLSEATDRKALLGIILELSKDQVASIKAMAIHSLAATVNLFETEELGDVAAVFSAGMRAHQEEIRVATIELWTQLLKYHPEGAFHEKIRSALNLIAAVPIESMTFAIMYKVVPLMPREYIKDETLQRGFKTLFSAVEPRWKDKGLRTLSLYISMAQLKNFAASEYEIAYTMFTDPAFCVRCAAGELFVDYTNILGWEWFEERAKGIIVDGVQKGNSLIRQSTLRTIAAFLAIDPPQKYRDLLIELLDQLEDCEDLMVQQNTRYCKKHIVNL